MTHRQSIIDTKTLEAMIESGEDLVLLFTTVKSGNWKKPSIIEENPKLRIPNSIYFDFEDVIVDKRSNVSNTMPSAEVFQREVRRLGVNNSSKVVVYDDFGNFCASRVWFMFKSVGFNNIQVLDGGLPNWISEDFPTVTNCVEPRSNGDFTTKLSSDYQFVSSDTVMENIETNAFQLFDARSPARFSGKEADPRKNVRSGHIPNSLNIHYSSLLDKKGHFLSSNELSEVFQKATGDFYKGAGGSLQANDGLIFSCGSGVTACILAQAADMQGIKPLYVYDGSWSEWGANDKFPIEASQKG